MVGDGHVKPPPGGWATFGIYYPFPPSNQNEGTRDPPALARDPPASARDPPDNRQVSRRSRSPPWWESPRWASPRLQPRDDRSSAPSRRHSPRRRSRRSPSHGRGLVRDDRPRAPPRRHSPRRRLNRGDGGRSSPRPNQDPGNRSRTSPRRSRGSPSSAPARRTSPMGRINQPPAGQRPVAEDGGRSSPRPPQNLLETSGPSGNGSRTEVRKRSASERRRVSFDTNLTAPSALPSPVSPTLAPAPSLPTQAGSSKGSSKIDPRFTICRLCKKE